MSDLIKDYLKRLRIALTGADPATIQDAFSDAEEHLWTALEQSREQSPGASEQEAVEAAIEKYGSPEEVAAAYLDIENRLTPSFGSPRKNAKKSAAARFFGIFTDPRSYASMFYMLFSLITGTFYFTWAVTGLSISVGIIILIVGIPIFGFFLLSVRGLALVEGRIIEALLGERMPRRPIFSRRDLGWLERIKVLFTDPMTWRSIIYMLLMLPLGVLYFNLIIISFSLALWGILRPVLEYGFDLPFAEFNSIAFYTPDWMMPLAVICGILWFLVTLHLARGLGRMHAKIAKGLLVKD